MWGGLSSKSITELAILEGKQNAEKYLNISETYIPPPAYALHGVNFKFMQKGAGVHTVRIVLTCLAL